MSDDELDNGFDDRHFVRTVTRPNEVYYILTVPETTMASRLPEDEDDYSDGEIEFPAAAQRMLQAIEEALELPPDCLYSVEVVDFRMYWLTVKASRELEADDIMRKVINTISRQQGRLEDTGEIAYYEQADGTDPFEIFSLKNDPMAQLILATLGNVAEEALASMSERNKKPTWRKSLRSIFSKR